MEFAERYTRALARTDKRQDAALLAAALAATGTGGALGALLCRARHTVALDDGAGDGLAGAETGRVLAQLLQLWTAEVARHGRARRWVADARPWDAHAAQRLYRAVAEHSLAHWLAPHYGDGAAPPACRGAFMRERVRDMVSELYSIADRHARLASRRLAGSAARSLAPSPERRPERAPERRPERSPERSPERN